MDLTIKEIADMLEVSKNTVKYHMRKLNETLEKEDYLYKNSGMIYVREPGVALVKESILTLHSETKGEDGIRQTETKEPVEQISSPIEMSETLNLLLKERDERLKALETELLYLRKDKEEASNQLEVKDEQIAELHKLLSQQQQLNLLAEAKIKELEESVPKSLSGSVETVKKWWEFWK